MTGEYLTVKLFELVGEFAEDKNKAKEIREGTILPAIEERRLVVLDFDKVNSATQSFIHALISEAMRRKGAAALDFLRFKNCNEVVREIISIVVAYMQAPPQSHNGNGA